MDKETYPHLITKQTWIRVNETLALDKWTNGSLEEVMDIVERGGKEGQIPCLEG